MACLRPVIAEEVGRAGFAAEDAEDVQAAATARLVEAFWDLREAATRAGQECASPVAAIRDPVGFARTLAAHAVADALRKRRPAWHRLKRRVVYLLDTPPPDNRPPLFARWNAEANWWGGFARWRGTIFRATNSYATFAADEPTCWKDSVSQDDPASLPLPALMTRLFHYVATPLEIDALTRHVAALCGITDPLPLPLDAPRAAGETCVAEPAASERTENTVVDAITGEIVRDALVREVALLPPRQRSALLMAMPRDDLILLFGTAHEVAALLEIDSREMPALWSALPLSDPAIGQRLGASPIQVSNLRKCARERLQRRRERWEQ